MQNLSENDFDEGNNGKYEKTNDDIILYNTQIFFLVIILFFFVYCEYNNIEYSTFSINIWGVFYKKQFYRIITHHFVHFGFGQIIINYFLISFLANMIEILIGTFYSFCIIFLLILFSSSIYLILCLFIKLVIIIYDSNYDIDFFFNLGSNSLIFSLFTYIFIFDSTFLYIKYILLFVLFFFISNSFLANISGIISGCIVFNLGKSILPNINGVKQLEKKLNLNNKYHYINIIHQKVYMEICLNEIFGNENCDNEEEGIELNEIKSNEEDNE
jgi:membrane associated rhomboid family serine protease